MSLGNDQDGCCHKCPQASQSSVSSITEHAESNAGSRVFYFNGVFPLFLCQLSQLIYSICITTSIPSLISFLRWDAKGLVQCFYLDLQGSLIRFFFHKLVFQAAGAGSI